MASTASLASLAQAQDSPAPEARVRPPVTAAALTPDERTIVLGSQAGIELRSFPELEPLRTFDTKLAHVHDLASSPDADVLLAAGGAPAERGMLEVWDWRTSALRRRVAAHDDVIYRVAWSPDGRRFATASADGRCQTFDAAEWRSESTYEGHSRAVLAIAFLPDGETLVSAGADQTIQLWRRADGQRLRTLDNHVGTINDMAVRPTSNPTDRPVLASVSEDRTVRLWQPTIGRLMRFARLDSIPRVVRWSSDSSRLYVGCNDGHVRTLDPDTMEIVADQPLLAGRVHELLIGGRSRILFAAGATISVKRPE